MTRRERDTVAKRDRYIDLRRSGRTQADALREVGIGRTTAFRIDKEFNLSQRTGGEVVRHDPDEVSEDFRAPDDPNSPFRDDPLDATISRPDQVDIEVYAEGSAGSLDTVGLNEVGFRIDTDAVVGIPKGGHEELIPDGHPARANQSWIPGSGARIDAGPGVGLPGPPARTPSMRDRGRARATRKPPPW